MPTPINLPQMSAKYLVDYVSHSGWAHGHEDVYRSGQLLAQVLPRFETRKPDSVSLTPSKDEPACESPRSGGQVEILVPEGPVAPVVASDGSPDFARMSKAEADDFRTQVREHNFTFGKWCRTMVPTFQLTDKQLDLCQRVMKYYSPRTDEEKQKDRDKHIPARPELPNNEFTFALLRELKLAVD